MPQGEASTDLRHNKISNEIKAGGYEAFYLLGYNAV
jgi:hypothetical protein